MQWIRNPVGGLVNYVVRRKKIGSPITKCITDEVIKLRKIALVKNNHPVVKRAIVYESGNGVYLFPCASLKDGSAIGDQWFASLSEADKYCAEEYGIESKDWEYIDDPLDDCQHDWIAPVRVKGRNVGRPQWGVLERLENGIWKEIVPELE